MTVEHWIVKWWGKVLTEQAIAELMTILRGK